MKKVISIFLTLSFCLNFAACSGKDIGGSSSSSNFDSSSAAFDEQGYSGLANESQDDEFTPVGSMTIDEAIKANLRADYDLQTYLADDGSVYCNSVNGYDGTLPMFFQGGAEKGLHSDKVKNIGMMSNDSTWIQAVTEDGEYWYGGRGIYQAFDDYDMERVVYVGNNVLYGLTTDGQIVMYNMKRESTEVVPEFSDVKYLFQFNGAVATVNRDGTVSLYELYMNGYENDAGRLLYRVEQERGYTNEHNWDAIIEEVSTWTDIAWLACGDDHITKEDVVLGLKNNGTVVSTAGCSIKDKLSGWTDMVYLFCDINAVYGLTSDGGVRFEPGWDMDKENYPEAVEWTGVKVLRRNRGITFDNRLLGDAQKLVYHYKPGMTPTPENGWTRDEVLEKLVVDGVEGSGGDMHVDHLVP